MNVKLNVMHRVYRQIIIAKQRIQTQQTHQTKIAQHFVQTTLSKQIVFQIKQQVLLIFSELALINATVW